MKQTAVEWLYEKLEYVNWMRNRDEISAGMADEWRKHYLDQAKAMEKEQHDKTAEEWWKEGAHYMESVGRAKWESFEQYYNETFKSE